MKFQLLLHQGVVDPRLHSRLSQDLQRIYSSQFGGAGEIAVEITEIPRGRFFTAAEPSRSSLIGGSIPAGTASADRTRLMSSITAMWCEVTGCVADEVVVSISDARA